MVQWATAEITKVQALAFLAISVAVIIAIGATFYRTKALVPTAVMAITGGLVLYAVHNTGVFQQKVGEDIHGLRPAVVLAAAAHTSGLAPQLTTRQHAHLQHKRAAGTDSRSWS